MQCYKNALRSFPNVDIHTNARTAEVLGEDHVTGLSYEDMSSGEMRRIKLRWYLCTNWPCAKYKIVSDAVELNSRGEVVVDRENNTNVPGILLLVTLLTKNINKSLYQ